MLDIQKVFGVLQKVCDARGMSVTIKEALKGGAAAFIGATTGGLIGGAVGMFIGGTLGSAIGAYYAHGRCVPVSTLIMDMTDSQKQELMDMCREIVAQLDWTDAALVGQLVMADVVMREQLVSKVSYYIAQQFNVKIEYTD